MKKGLLFAAALLAAGCAPVGPNYQRPAIELPGDYPDTAAASAAAQLRTDWWTLYQDATLSTLVAAAQTRNTDMRLATAQLDEAEAALREVDANTLPQVDGGFTNTRSQVSRLTALPNAQPLIRPERRLAASTSFEIDFWGRLRRTTEAARAQALSSRYGRDVVALTLAGTTAQVYFALRSVDAQLAVSRISYKAREDSLQVTRDRVAATAGAPPSRNSGHQLGQLTGQLDLKLAPGSLDTLPVPPLPPPGLPAALLERRPDVQVAEQNLVANNARIGVAKAALFPSISLTGILGSQSGAFSNLLLSGSGIWTLGFGLALPIFDGGRLAARAEQAEARQRQSLANYQKAVETAFRETADAISNLDLTSATETDLQVRVAAARDALDISRTRYAAGYSGFLEVLDAQRTANDAELALVRNRQARLAFSVDLMKALGGGWSAPAKP